MNSHRSVITMQASHEEREALTKIPNENVYCQRNKCTYTWALDLPAGAAASLVGAEGKLSSPSKSCSLSGWR